MKRQETMPVGIIVQRRRIAHPWQEWAWEAVGVLPWAEEGVSWRLLTEEPDRIRYHAATLALDLHRGDTEAYIVNLESEVPAIYVVLRPDPEGDHEVTPYHVTVSPYDAQHYLHSGDEIVERLTLPDAVLAWLKDFVDCHHEPEAFVKRQRQGLEERPDAGRGDARIRQTSDVYRAPGSRDRGRT